MNIVFNDEAQQWELKTQGVLREILADPEDGVRENSNGNAYKLGLVDVTYPDNSTEVITASIWGASLDAHPDKFQPNAKVGLAINVDPNSEYRGNAKIELPGGKVDTTRMIAGLTLPEGFGKATGTAKKVSENA